MVSSVQPDIKTICSKLSAIRAYFLRPFVYDRSFKFWFIFYYIILKKGGKPLF